MDKELKVMFEAAEDSNLFDVVIDQAAMERLTPEQAKANDRLLSLKKYVEAYDKLEQHIIAVAERLTKAKHELAHAQGTKPDDAAANMLRGRVKALEEVHDDLRQIKIAE